MRAFILSIPLLLAAAIPALGSELAVISPSHLRHLVAQGQAISTRRALSALGLGKQDEVIDIHAFRGQHVYYRIVILHPSGRLGAFIFDATTGKTLLPSSAQARTVEAAAEQTSAPGRVVSAAQQGKAHAANARANSLRYLSKKLSRARSFKLRFRRALPWGLLRQLCG